MPAEIEIQENGKGAMFAVGTAPWHELGTVLDNPPTVEEALRLAGLDWTVGLKNLAAVLGTDNEGFQDIIDVPGYYATVRENDKKVLGIVKQRYKVVQNAQALAFMKPFVESNLVTLETAGSLKGGRKIWILAKIKNQTADVVPNDAVDPYLLFHTSHDGSTNADVLFTPTRVVCMNTLRIALQNAKNAHRIRHTGNIDVKIEKVQDAIAETNTQFQDALTIYRSLANRNITTEKFSGYIKSVFGEEIRKDKVEKLTERFESGRGQDIPGVSGTAWAAYNAVTEYLSYDYGRSADNRMDSLWFGQNVDINQQAFVYASQL